MTAPLGRPDSKTERIRTLVLEELDALSRPPYASERTSAVLSKLKPHVETELEALETLEWLRDLTGEELAQRRLLTMLLSAVGHGTGGFKTANERILEALRPGAATNSELQKRTGTSAGTVRNGLCQLIKDGKVVAEGERYPRTYRLAASVSERTLGG